MASGPAFRYIKCMHGAEVLVNGSAGQVSDCMTESHVSGLKEAMSLPEKLLKSAKVGNSRDVRKLLGRGVPITKDKFGNTALHEAAWNGHSDIVKLLLNTFCFVDSINNSGFTPLHLASQSGHGKAVKTLLKWRSDPSLLNQHGETAIHLAAKYNHPTVISVFVSFKINMDLKGKDGNTALHIAAKLGNTESVRALLRGGANPQLMNVRGARAAEYAEIGGFKHVIKLLNSKSKLRSRSMTESKSSNSQTPSPTATREPQTLMSPTTTTTSMKTGGESPQITPKASLSPRLHRANSASARFNYHGLQRRQASVPSALTSTVQTAHFTRDPSPSNSYAEIGSPTSSPKISPKLPPPPPPPTIDQLLTEIEQECNGSSYKYSPPGPPVGPPGGEVLVSPYKFSLPESRGALSQEAWVFPYGPTPSSNGRYSRPNSLQDCPYHQKSASLDGYEGIRGGGGGGGRGESGLHVTFLPPHEMQAVQNAVDKTFESMPAHPSHSDETYVFMAPCREVQSSSPQPSHSSQESCQGNGDTRTKIPKRAIICSSPVVPDQRHEPKNSLSPARGILSQPSSPQQTDIDRYLQQELETMRRAFQIRLVQLEKRYQRQLWMARQRNSTTAVPSDVQLRPERTGTSFHRRSSWHSCVSDSDDYEELTSGNIHRSGSSQGFDSDFNPGSEDEAFDDQSVERNYWSHDQENVTPTIMTSSSGYQVRKNVQRSQSLAVNSTTSMNGMRTVGERMWNLEQGNGARAGPTPVEEDEGVKVMEGERKEREEVDSGTLPPRAKALVNERVSEHRQRILQYFQQVSEARIAAIERQYESQMASVESKYHSQATEKLSRLETRVKDLEKMLDIETETVV